MNHYLIVVGLVCLLENAPTSGRILPGYGASFIQKGKVLTNLQKFDLTVALQLPNAYEPIGKTTQWIQDRLCHGSSNDSKTLVSYICAMAKPMFERFQKKEITLIDKINQAIQFDLPALLPALKMNSLANLQKQGEEVQFQTNAQETPYYEHFDKEKCKEIEVKLNEVILAQGMKDASKHPHRGKRSVGTEPKDPPLEDFPWWDNRYQSMLQVALGSGKTMILKPFQTKGCLAHVGKKKAYPPECLTSCALPSADSITLAHDHGCIESCAQSSAKKQYVEQLDFNRTTGDSICVNPYTREIETHPQPEKIGQKLSGKAILKLLVNRTGLTDQEAWREMKLAAVTKNIPEIILDEVRPPKERTLVSCAQKLFQMNPIRADRSDDCLQEIEELCVIRYYGNEFRLLINVTDLSPQMASKEEAMVALDNLLLNNSMIQSCPDRDQQMWLQKEAKFQMQTKPRSRSKRAVPLMALISLGALVKDTVGMAIGWNKNKKFKKAIETLAGNQERFQDSLKVMADQMAAVVATENQHVEELWTQAEKQQEATNAITAALMNMQTDLNKKFSEQKELVEFLAWMEFQVRSTLEGTLDKLQLLYERIEDLMSSLDNLSSGTLTHVILAPSKMATYLQNLDREIANNMPRYELALPELNKYYDAKMVSFVALNYTLYINVPVFLKRKNQPESNLLRIASVPIPVEPEDIKPDIATGEWKGDYSHIIFDKEYLVVDTDGGKKQALSLTRDDLETCTKFGQNYYCTPFPKQSFSDEHQCPLHVYSDNIKDIAEYCQIQYLRNYVPTPTVLQDETEMLLVGMPPPWSSHCEEDVVYSARPTLVPSAAVVVNKAQLCGCDLLVGGFPIPETLSQCGDDTKQGKHLKYALNSMVAYFFRDILEEDQHILKQNPTLVWKGVSWPLSGKLLTDQPIDIKLPNMTVLDQGQSMEEKRALRSVAFRDLLKSVKDNKDLISRAYVKPNLDFSFTPELILAGVSITIMAIVFFISCFICCKGSDYLSKYARKQEQMMSMSSIGPSDESPTVLIRGPKRKGVSFVNTPLLVLTTIACCLPSVNAEESQHSVDVEWTIRDISIFLGLGLLAHFIIRIFCMILAKHCFHCTQYLAKHTCNSWQCGVWQERCDFYLLISRLDCKASCNVLLGSVLGPPTGLKIKTIHLVRGLFFNWGTLFDHLQIEWERTALTYQDSTLTLPRVISVWNPITRIRLRHALKPTSTPATCLAIVYNDTLLIKPIEPLSFKSDPPYLPTPKPRHVTTHFQLTTDEPGTNPNRKRFFCKDPVLYPTLQPDEKPEYSAVRPSAPISDLHEEEDIKEGCT